MKEFWTGFYKRAENFYPKRHYGEMRIEDLDPHRNDQVWTAKIDGAMTRVVLKKGETPRLFSHRMSKRTGGPIEYTAKLPHIKTPSKLDAQIRGEVYAVDRRGRAVEPEMVTSILNSGPEKSLELQKRLGLTTRTALIDVDDYMGQDMREASYTDKRKVMEEIAKGHPEFTLPATATTPAAKRSLLSQILSGKQTETKEGQVVHTGSTYTKAKTSMEHDVIVRDIFHEQATTAGRHHMAGGFSYSWTPEGPVVGKVGTGFHHRMKKDMLLNPDSYIGQVARVRALSVSKNNVLVKPSFRHWHVERNINDDVGSEKIAAYAKQSIIIAKTHASDRDKAKEVARGFADRLYTSRETSTSYRFRQKPPAHFVEGSYRTKSIPKKGVTIVYGQLKEATVDEPAIAKKRRELDASHAECGSVES